MGRIALLIALVAGGCGRAAPLRTNDDPARTCEDVIARYRARLAGGTGRCLSDADCAAYGGVDPADVCGGATDAETARALAAISAELEAEGCPRAGYSCPPIDARCVAHACR